jgi:hypothetical protein
MIILLETVYKRVRSTILTGMVQAEPSRSWQTRKMVKWGREGAKYVVHLSMQCVYDHVSQCAGKSEVGHHLCILRREVVSQKRN